MALVDDVRAAAARVAAEARHVRIDEGAIPAYARSLDLAEVPTEPDRDAHFVGGSLEDRAAYTCMLDAINFGSGWFPELRKRDGRSGYFTIAAGLRDRFEAEGPWQIHRLSYIDAAEIARWLRQDPGHVLMKLYAYALCGLAVRVIADFDRSFLTLARSTRSAVALAERVGGWPMWNDVSDYHGARVPFFKRAQILPADLALAGVAEYDDLDRLTAFADNLVPHVLRLDGVLLFSEPLTEWIEQGEPLFHDSPEEIEIRACALHAVELIAAERGDASPHQLDYVLWNRGQEPHYKAVPRHRACCVAY